MSRISLSAVFISFITLAALAMPPHTFADWIIDRSGTLVEIEDLALIYGSPATVAEVRGKNPQEPGEVEGRNPNYEIRDDTMPKKMGYTLEQMTKMKENFENSVESREKKLKTNKQQIKSKIESEEGKLVVTQETKNEKGQTIKTQKTPIKEQEKLHLEVKSGEMVEVRAQKNDSLEIEGEKTRTRTNYPIGVSEDGSLTITHKDGEEKVVTVLPDKAKENFEKRGLDIQSNTQTLEIEEDEPTYVAEVKEKKKLLGFINMSFFKKGKVSGDSGEVTLEDSEKLTGWQKFLERISF